MIFLGSGLGSRLRLRPMGPGLVSTSPLSSSSIAADADSTLSISPSAVGSSYRPSSLRILGTNQVLLLFPSRGCRTSGGLASARVTAARRTISSPHEKRPPPSETTRSNAAALLFLWSCRRRLLCFFFPSVFRLVTVAAAFCQFPFSSALEQSRRITEHAIVAPSLRCHFRSPVSQFPLGKEGTIPFVLPLFH